MLGINYSNLENLSFTFFNVLIHVFFLSVLVYLNLYYLIPKYLQEKKIILYLVQLLFFVVVATPLELFCLYWNFNGYNEARLYLIQNQYFHLLYMVLITSSSTFVKVFKEWLLQERIKRDLVKKNLESELSFLKSQINPHFLFNTLNSLYALSLKKSDKAPELILHLSEMMRYMLYGSNEKYVKLSTEVNYIKNYLELEKLRYDNKAVITFDFESEVENDIDLPPLLLIPFVENAFKHGLGHTIEGGYVKIKLNVKKNQIDFWVENSKPSSIKNNDNKSGGIGLKNVRRRLDLYFADNYNLSIREELTGFFVNLQIILF
jgi:LytS/YehU family sensor histidine kinase